MRSLACFLEDTRYGSICRRLLCERALPQMERCAPRSSAWTVQQLLTQCPELRRSEAAGDAKAARWLDAWQPGTAALGFFAAAVTVSGHILGSAQEGNGRVGRTCRCPFGQRH
jgi:hypothetical protein